MFHPTCAFVCRRVVKGCPLLRTPEYGGDVFGMGYSTMTVQPDCCNTDPAFLRTKTLCLGTYCPLTDNHLMSLLEYH